MRKPFTLYFLFAGFVGMCMAVGLQASQLQRRIVPLDDRVFAIQAATGNMLELQLGQLAQEKSRSMFIRNFGERMIVDHDLANRELDSISDRKGFRMPRRLDLAHQRTYDRLINLSGEAFDAQYLTTMRELHEADLAKYRQFLRRGKDQEIRNYASKGISMIENHLRMLRTGSTKG